MEEVYCGEKPCQNRHWRCVFAAAQKSSKLRPCRLPPAGTRARVRYRHGRVQQVGECRHVILLFFKHFLIISHFISFNSFTPDLPSFQRAVVLPGHGRVSEVLGVHDHRHQGHPRRTDGRLRVQTHPVGVFRPTRCPLLGV